MRQTLSRLLVLLASQQALSVSHPCSRQYARSATHLPSPFCRKANNFRGLFAFLHSYVATIKSAYTKKSLDFFHNYVMIVATMYVDTSHITRGGKTYTRHLLRESYRAHGKVLHRTISSTWII